jgi:SAM-dependent methyltransferase
MTGKLPLEPSSVDIVIPIFRSIEFPGDLLVKEMFRVLKPGGTILIYSSQQSVIGETDKVNINAFFCVVWIEFSLSSSFSPWCFCRQFLVFSASCFWVVSWKRKLYNQNLLASPMWFVLLG